MRIAPSVRSGLRSFAWAASICAAFGCQPQPATTPAAEASSTVTAEPTPPAAPSPEEAAQQAAQSGAQAWLALVDAGQYEASWDAASDLFQSSVSKEQWNGALQGARTPLGALGSRQLRGSEYKTDVPGAPPGKYVIVYYDAAYGQKPAAKEVVTLKQADDESWKVAGYVIQ